MRVGDKVEVLLSGKWRPATIEERNDPHFSVKVSAYPETLAFGNPALIEGASDWIRYPLEVSDSVNHPSHYKWLPVEAIEITEHFNFCMGNALKYIIRADHKGNPLEDLKKAEFYIRREIKRREMLQSDTRGK